jgi:rhodanese-related sulfurtransferase
MSYQMEFSLTIDCLEKDEIMERIHKKANFVLIDTIGKYNGNRFKIKGARTIPFPEVIDRRKELSSYEEIIIYCKDRDCKASKKVALGLKLLNIPHVKVYEGGIDEWLANRLPVEEE